MEHSTSRFRRAERHDDMASGGLEDPELGMGPGKVTR
jgi:hypothetical protein